MRMTDTTANSTQNQSLTQKREQARLLYAQGLGVTQIARQLDEKRATVASWKKRDGWVRADIFTDVNLAMKARLLSLIGMEKKGNGEYKEIDELMRQLERIAGEVGVLVNVGALVVVAEDHGAIAKARTRGANALMAGVVLQLIETVKGDGGGLH